MADRLRLREDRSWNLDDGVAVRGGAFVDDEYREGPELHTAFAGVDTLAAFVAALDRVAGFFAVAIDTGEGCLVAVDHARSIPMVYAPERMLVGDDARALREDGEATSWDPVAESELLVGGNVLDNRTLDPGVRTVRPGEAVWIGPEDVETIRYAAFDPRTDGPAHDAAAEERLSDAIDAAFDRFARLVGDRRVAIALSGGADSRLVVTELASRDVDLLAYSFGREDAEDVRVARRVAALLDVPWVHVPYSSDRWREWYLGDERSAYVRSAAQLDAIPNYGAMPSIAALRERGYLPSDAVCSSGQTVAGLSEDLPVPPDRDCPTREAVVEGIVRYWSRWRVDDGAFEAVLREQIAGTLPGGDPLSLAEALGAMERWKLDERHSKYFLAEVRQYDFHGLDWWLPLWDPQVVDAWADVPFARRRGKQCYRELVDRRFAGAAGIPVADAAGLGVSVTAPTTIGRLIDDVAERVVDTPVAPLLAGVYWRLQRARSDYGDHPLGWYGILPPELFAQLYSGREDIHAMQALETVGRASFVDGTVTDPPVDGVLSLPYGGES